MYVNDLPQHTTTSSAALLADDTKCYHAIRQDLQRDMDGINVNDCVVSQYTYQLLLGRPVGVSEGPLLFFVFINDLPDFLSKHENAALLQIEN